MDHKDGRGEDLSGAAKTRKRYCTMPGPEKPGTLYVNAERRDGKIRYRANDMEPKYRSPEEVFNADAVALISGGSTRLDAARRTSLDYFPTVPLNAGKCTGSP